MKAPIVWIAAAAAALTAQAAPAATELSVKYPEFQRTFMVTIQDYADLYKAAPNELKKSALVTARHEAFRKLKGDPRAIKDWIGVIDSMGTTGDGRAYVTLNLHPRLLWVGTWNNSFSDIGDKTLIPQSSQVYKALADMKPGNVVKFSGRLKRPSNLLEEDRMLNPTFLFSFTHMEKIGDSRR